MPTGLAVGDRCHKYDTEDLHRLRAVDEEEERLARERERLYRWRRPRPRPRRAAGEGATARSSDDAAGLKLTNEEQPACPALDGTSGRDDATLQPMG